MRIETYDRIIDPGHSWLIVPLKHLQQAGVVDQITAYSPLVGNKVYLEEDCDMYTFVDAMKKQDVIVDYNCVFVDDLDQYLDDNNLTAFYNWNK